MSNCQIIGPCSEILVVCVFSLYAFAFASCLLPPLCWNDLVWSDPSFLLKKQGGNLSWKHHFCWWDSWKLFGDVSLLTAVKGVVCSTSSFIGMLGSGMVSFCLLKACRKCSKHWVDRAKSEQKSVLLSREEEILGYYYSYCKWKWLSWPADCTQHNYYY